MGGFRGLIKAMTGTGVVGAGANTGSGSPSDMQSTVESFGNEHWADLKTAYIAYHAIVWDALLKYSGVLWINWNNNNKSFDVTYSDDEWTPTPEVNRFSPAIDSMSSNFQQIPDVEAIPERVEDMASYTVADIATRLARHVMKISGLHQDIKTDADKAGRAGALLTIAGTVFTDVRPTSKKVGMKDELGQVPALQMSCPTCQTPPQTIPLSQLDPAQLNPACPNCGGMQQIAQTQTMGPTGNKIPVIEHSITVKIGNPLCMLPRPGALHMDNLRYSLWAERMSIEEVFENWQIEAQADPIQIDGYNASYENVLQYYFTGSASSTVRTKEECMVVQMFIEPGKVRAIPKGCYAVMVNSAWKVFPWQTCSAIGEHPLTKTNYKNQPMLFFGRTDAFDLSKLQKEKGHYEALIKLHAMTCASDSLLLDDNTKVDEVTGRGDKVVRWRSLGPGSHPPSRLQHGSLDNGVYVQRDKIDSEFQNISGAVAVWRGENPGSITAASAIAQLRGQAEQMFATPEGNWNSLWTQTIRKAVKTLQATMEPYEILKIVGDGKDVEVQLFKSCDLDTMVSFVSSKTGLPKTKSERREEMMTLFDHGALDTSQASVKEEIHELFGETGMNQMFNKHATRARMENQLMRNGQPKPRVLVGIEDMEVHADIHREQIVSLDFDKWEDPAKQELIAHMMETLDAIGAVQANQAAGGQGATDPNVQAGAGAGKAGAGPVAGPGPAQPGPGGARTPKPGGGPPNRRPGGRRSPAPANNQPPNVPTGPNGPGSGGIPGGNR